MKKRVVFVLLFICVLCLFASCKEEHVHSFTPWETIKSPTCIEQGIVTRSCTGCDRTENIPIDPGGHTEVKLDAKEPTCTEQGLTEGRKCTVCETITVAQQLIDMKAHQATATAAMAPSCTKEGYTAGKKCTVCGAFTEVPQTVAKIPHVEAKIPAKAATCTEEGSTEGIKCSVCNETIKAPEKTEKTQHNYKESITKTATCTEAGTKTKTCLNCGDKQTESYNLKAYTSQEIFNLVGKSVGEITTFDRVGNGFALGTGFVFSQDGKIITNYHVIENAYSAQILLDGKTYKVEKVLAFDQNIDLAVLQINAKDLTPLTVCKKDMPTGATVYAFGSSKGFTDTFSQGIVSHSKRIDGGVTYIQHTAAISSGNSGGPLINEYGEVVGINTWTLTNSQNLNFAVFTTELDNLDYSNPLTVSELYDEAHNNAYVEVVDWLYDNGNENGKYVEIYEDDPESEDITYNLYWNTSEKALYAAVYQDLSSTMYYFTTINLSFSEEIYDYCNYFNYPDGSSDYVYGEFTAAVYTLNSNLIYTESSTSGTNAILMNNSAQANVSLILIWLDGFLYDNLGLDLYDFGFAAIYG